MTLLYQPHPTNTMNGLMTEGTWGPPRVCPGAEVRPGGRRQNLVHLGEAEQRWCSCSKAALWICWGPLVSQALTCCLLSFRKTRRW